MVAAFSNWLCPNEIDRARVVDNSARVIKARNIVSVCTGVTLLIATPKFGAWILLLFAMAMANTLTLDRRVERSRRPEFHILASFIWIELLMGIGIFISGGHDSPALALMVLPCGFSASRFRATVNWAITGFGLLVMALAAVPQDPVGTLHDPYTLLITAVLLVGMTACVQVLAGAEYEQRGESSLDHLTGMLNRASLERRFVEVAAQARIAERPMAMLVGDVDHFKRVNDVHGHATGDAVLKGIAEALGDELRAVDLIYRFGGEEFVVLLARADEEAALAVADRLRTAVERARPGDLDVTISWGVATGVDVDFDGLFAAADRALYSAKQAGRNRVASVPRGASLAVGERRLDLLDAA
jgi:diguanylate cyclase (GGDEF)-like protein